MKARSFIARSPEKFGIIQASLIDTFAASSAGAYVLTENGLDTKEAWPIFMDHLAPEGILTMSRWYNESQPTETLRLAGLATASLIDEGVQNPRQHVMIIRKQDTVRGGEYGVATILVSKQPFSDAEIDRMDELSKSMKFITVVTPRYAESRNSNRSLLPGYEELIRSYPLNIEAPTDDRPFFFHMIRAADLLNISTYQAMNDANQKVVTVLGMLLLIVIALTAIAIIAPLALRGHGAVLAHSCSWFILRRSD